VKTPARDAVRTERMFQRFRLGQRWEHALLILSFTVLLITGLPQKYRNTSWSHYILATPERVELVRTVHHAAAVLFILEALYHVGGGLLAMSRRKLSSDIFPTGKDVRDAGQMLRYLLFLAPSRPRFGKYSFEQKFTYWFLFFGFGILIVSGLIQWFPEFFTRFLPGGIIPAAKLAHSSEAIVSAIFIVLWHFYHVHLERLNLSIFTGRLSERDMRRHHALEFERLTGEPASDGTPGDGE
jgi:formate dehydrogenase gamma subunit